MIAVGSAMFIWVTVLLFADKRLSQKEATVIEAAETDSNTGGGIFKHKEVDQKGAV